MKFISTIFSSFTFLFCYLFSENVFAFGPVVHSQISNHILSNLHLIQSPEIVQLLTHFPSPFIYGSMAADVIIAKGLSKVEKHPHNWEVGFKVLESSQTDSERAFAWGYLTHLAADVVAHNYFVPAKMVESYWARTAGHAYWEVRLDELASQESWLTFHHISKQKFQEEHKLLERTIEGTIFRFDTNVAIFNGMLFVQRLKRWKRLLQTVSDRSRLKLPISEADGALQMSIEAALDLLNHQKEARICLQDPTGWRNLKVSKELRVEFRKGLRNRLFSKEELSFLLLGCKKAFAQFAEGLSLPTFPFPFEIPPQTKVSKWKLLKKQLMGKE